MRISDWSSDVCSSDLVIDRHRPVEVSERQRSRHLAPRCDVDALCGAAEVLDMRDPSRTDEERTLGLGGEAWLILVDQHRVELRHRSRVSCLDAEGGIEDRKSGVWKECGSTGMSRLSPYL